LSSDFVFKLNLCTIYLWSDGSHLVLFYICQLNQLNSHNYLLWWQYRKHCLAISG